MEILARIWESCIDYLKHTAVPIPDVRRLPSHGQGAIPAGSFRLKEDLAWSPRWKMALLSRFRPFGSILVSRGDLGH